VPAGGAQVELFAVDTGLHGIEHPQGLLDHFDPDPVAGNDGQSHRASLSSRRFRRTASSITFSSAVADLQTSSGDSEGKGDRLAARERDGGYRAALPSV
jgi:hypothetical protein